MRNQFLFKLLIVLNAITFTLSCKGCISLDEYNFEKILTRFKAVIVKFDVAYPYGEKHEQFVKFAEEIVTSKDIIAAEVGIKDYGDKDNENLAKKYGIKVKDDLPIVKLFLGDPEKFVDLPKESPFNVESFRNLVRDNSDVYIGLPGCIEEFDNLALSFIDSSNKEGKMKEAESILEKTEKKERAIGETYLLFMKKILENGSGFVEKEKSRLNKLLKEAKMNEKKKTELTYRLNILHSFKTNKDEL